MREQRSRSVASDFDPERLGIPSPAIVLITGIMAAGKSTVAQALAERLPRSVHLRGDVFRRMIVNGRAPMGSDFSDEDLRQLRLRYRLAANAANLYCEAGFSVVYQDVVIGPLLAEVIELLEAWPLHVVVLCPTAEAAAQRDRERNKTAYGSWTPQVMAEELRTNTPQVGYWLDSTSLTVSETVDAILTHVPDTRLGLRSKP